MASWLPAAALAAAPARASAEVVLSSTDSESENLATLVPPGAVAPAESDATALDDDECVVVIPKRASSSSSAGRPARRRLKKTPTASEDATQLRIGEGVLPSTPSLLPSSAPAPRRSGSKRSSAAAAAPASAAAAAAAAAASQPSLCDPCFAPLTSAECAVAPKKMRELVEVLQEALDGPAPGCRAVRVVALTGLAGVGKSAAVLVAARELQATVVQWEDPMRRSDDPEDRLNRLGAFRDFLRRALGYGGLQVEEGGEADEPRCRRVVLVDDVSFVREDAPDDAARFQEAVQSVLAGPAAAPPLVFIFSRAFEGRSDFVRLFPQALSGRPSFRQIDLRPCTVPRVVAAMERVLRLSRRAPRPTKAQVRQLAEGAGGDVRNALLSLDWFILAPEAGFAGVSGRDVSSILFRTIGKILHQKRGATAAEPSGVAWRPALEPVAAPLPLPAQEEEGEDDDDVGGFEHEDSEERLAELRAARPPLAFSPDAIIADAAVPGALLVLYLAENYPRFYTTMHDTAQAAAALAVGHRVAAHWAGGGVASQDSPTEAMGAAVAARALAWENLHPPPPGHRAFTAFHKPQALQAARDARQAGIDLQLLLFRGGQEAAAPWLRGAELDYAWGVLSAGVAGLSHASFWGLKALVEFPLEAERRGADLLREEDENPAADAAVGWGRPQQQLLGLTGAAATASLAPAAGAGDADDPIEDFPD